MEKTGTDNKARDMLQPVLKYGLVVLYVALMAVNFLGELAGLPRMLKMAGVVVVGIAVLRFLICFDVENAKYIPNYFMIISIPVVIVLSVSVAIWLPKLFSFSDMMSASERLLVQFINVFVALAAIYLFKGAAMRYTLYGMSVAYGYIIFRAISRFGIPSFIQSLIKFVTSLGIQTTGAMAALEVHDMTFAFGFFVLYYLTCPKDEPHRKLCILLSTVCFVLGYKRIAILAVGAALIYNWHFKHVREEEKSRALKRASVWLFVLCYAYLLITRYDLFIMLMDAMGIDTMGRNRLYAFINQYYDFSPSFMGYGFDYVQIFLVDLREAGLSQFETASIHNEIVRQYIEMGFWGFLLWCSYETLVRPRWMLEAHGLEAGKMYLLCSIYIYITYLTDNTMFYYHTAFAYRLVPLVVAQMYHDQGEQQIRMLTKGLAYEKGKD